MKRFQRYIVKFLKFVIEQSMYAMVPALFKKLPNLYVHG